VIGSRYVKGGLIRNWGIQRHLISRGANLLTKSLTKISVNDATSGFRCYHKNVIKTILPFLKSTGFEIQVEILIESIKKNFKIVEWPIKFSNRKHGKSKLKLVEIFKFIKILYRKTN
jgi:dolichol-phosphate mannosyltransferase